MVQHRLTIIILLSLMSQSIRGILASVGITSMNNQQLSRNKEGQYDYSTLLLTMSIEVGFHGIKPSIVGFQNDVLLLLDENEGTC